MASVADRRVVVTGLGIVSSLGQDIDTFWSSITAGKCGISLIESFDTTEYDCKIAAEIKEFDPNPAFPSPKEVRRTDRFVQLGVFAGHRALLDSGMDLEKLDRDEIGVFIGSGIGGLKTTEEQHKALMEKGPNRVSPFMIPMLILNMASGMFSMYYGLRGPNIATCSACATIGGAAAAVGAVAAVAVSFGSTQVVSPVVLWYQYDCPVAGSCACAHPRLGSRVVEAAAATIVLTLGAAHPAGRCQCVLRVLWST